MNGHTFVNAGGFKSAGIAEGLGVHEVMNCFAVVLFAVMDQTLVVNQSGANFVNARLVHMHVNHFAGFSKETIGFTEPILPGFFCTQKREFRQALNRPQEMAVNEVDGIRFFEVLNCVFKFFFKVVQHARFIQIVGFLQILFLITVFKLLMAESRRKFARHILKESLDGLIRLANGNESLNGIVKACIRIVRIL
jgi:hypothetical protein